VPMGYLVGAPASCNSGCDAPIWVVDEEAWTSAGGEHLGRSFVRGGPNDSTGWDGVSLGELPLGDGVVRIIGALLPEPTQDNFHPYGLASYGLTYTGYQLFENTTTWDNPGRTDTTDPQDPDDEGDDRPGKRKGHDKGGDHPGQGGGSDDRPTQGRDKDDDRPGRGQGPPEDRGLTGSLAAVSGGDGAGLALVLLAGALLVAGTVLRTRGRREGT
jgi:hypothetical protein